MVIEALTPAELQHDRRWWEIYESSIPAEEREPPPIILQSLSQGGQAFRARAETRTIGIATTQQLHRALFLVYLAADELHRGQGIGTRLFTAVAPLHRSVVWEVDPPATDTGRRRIAFFERLGGIVLPRPYWQPPVNGTGPVPMQLMYRPAAPACILPDPAAIEDLVRSIYFDKYAAVNGIPAATLEALLTLR